MFRAKVSALFRNVSNNTLQCDSTLIKIPANALYSNTAVSTNIVQKPVPDKLYKKIEIEVRGNDPAVLKSYGVFTQMAAENLGITITRNTAPHKAVHERLTVLKSVHIYKKHRVQYEMRTYFRFIDLEKITGSTADTFLEYIQRNLPEGVAMKVTKVEIQKLPNHIRSPQS